MTDCAEVFTSRLAGAIDLPAAECRFAILDGEPGLISRNVTPRGFNLNTGTTYLPEVEGYRRRPSAGSDSKSGRMRLDEGYTLDSVEQVLEQVGAPPGVSDLSGFVAFAGYLVLDALVGNGDRHPGNWAILERQSDRQDPETRRYSRVGVLSNDGHLFRFKYCDGVTRALPGLPLGRMHESESLFPIFAERVMDTHRPERAATLERLGLGAEAEPLEVLAVSGGGRTGDTYELTPLPQSGPVSLPFLVHGIRHLTSEERAAIDDLKPGDRLELRCRPDNEFNERALLVRQTGDRLGYVPDPLLDYVHRIMERPFEFVVARVNPVEAGMHMRLLVRLTGDLVA